MDYKTELTGLAADLQSAIDKANALPDAGGGGNAPATIGENLHDVSTDVPNTYLSGGNVSSYNGWTSTDYIPVEAGKYYLAYSTSAISANYCSQFDTNQSFIKGFSGILNCTDKNRPVFIEGNDGYVRFSGTAAQIDALEFYEVLNFKWELPT